MTTVKRFKVKSEAETNQYVQKLRRKGRSAWMELDGNQYFLCVRMQVVRIRADLTIRPHQFN